MITVLDRYLIVVVHCLYSGTFIGSMSDASELLEQSELPSCNYDLEVNMGAITGWKRTDNKSNMTATWHDGCSLRQGSHNDAEYSCPKMEKKPWERNSCLLSQHCSTHQWLKKEGMLFSFGGYRNYIYRISDVKQSDVVNSNVGKATYNTFRGDLKCSWPGWCWEHWKQWGRFIVLDYLASTAPICIFEKDLFWLGDRREKDVTTTNDSLFPHLIAHVQKSLHKTERE